MVAGMLLSFDVAPFMLGVELKRYSQGYHVNKAVLIGLLFIFLMGLVGNFYIRIQQANNLVDYSSGGIEYADGLDANSGDTNGSNMKSMTLFAAMIPFLTTGVSFIASWMSTNPLKKALKKKCILEDHIHRYEEGLKECELEDHMLQELTEDDNARYFYKQKEIEDKAKELRSYVRDQIKIHLGEAVAISELSASDGLQKPESFENVRIA